MKKLKFLSVVISSLLYIPLHSQSFFDDFESYTVGTYLGDSSNKWTTWNNAPGTSEDTKIDSSEHFSGKNSIFFSSQFGNGPQDVVLPFGGRHTTGHFRFTSKWKINNKTGAYFNFQGGVNTGNSWAMDVYMYDDATIDVSGYLSGTYPQGRWFELVVDIDLDKGQWEVLIDGSSLGTFTNPTNSVSYLDIYPLFSGSNFWVDDVGYCINNSCLPDIEFQQFSINPDPLCSNQYGDIQLKLKNNGPEIAKSFNLGVQLDGQKTQVKTINLGLAKGRDTTINVSGLFKTNQTGTNLVVKAINFGGDRNEANDTLTYLLDVKPSPSGFTMIKGNVFEGVFNYNNTEDLLEASKTNSYEITAPTGYSNSGYPLDWIFNNITVKTTGGSTIPSNYYQFTPPNSGANGTFSINVDSTYIDSLLLISVNVRVNSTGCDSTLIQRLRIIPTPILRFNIPSNVCVGDNINIKNSSSIHSGSLSYKWYFGDGDSSDFLEPVHQYSTTGTYVLTFQATSFPYGIVADTSITIQVNEIPNAKFSVKNKCEGKAIEFTNQSSISNGSQLNYEWNFGDGTSNSTLKDPNHLFSQVGTYKVTLTATSNGCSSTYERQAITFPTPKAGFQSPSVPICARAQVDFINTSTIQFGQVGYYWKFGDGKISTLEKGVHFYDTAGSYDITLIAVSEFDCRDSINHTITIKPAPKPDFEVDILCENDPSLFKNTTKETLPNPIYTWNFSDNYNSSNKNVVRNWNNSGPINVELTAKFSNFCEASILKEFNILIQPNAKFSVKDICSGESAHFVNQSSGDNSNIKYSWDFGLSGNNSEDNPIVLYNPNKTTTYTVSLIASYDGGCSDTAFKTITVSESPVCDFTYKKLGFNGAEFTPSNSSYAKYEWFFGEGGTSTSVSPMYQYLYSGNFNVTMKATNAAGCSCETTKRISANTSVDQLAKEAGVSVYPNPNNGSFTVTNASGSAMKVEVFNILGAKVYSAVDQNGSLIVDLAQNAKGIYLVKVTINGVTTTLKVTVD